MSSGEKSALLSSDLPLFDFHVAQDLHISNVTVDTTLVLPSDSPIFRIIPSNLACLSINSLTFNFTFVTFTSKILDLSRSGGGKIYLQEHQCVVGNCADNTLILQDITIQNSSSVGSSLVTIEGQERTYVSAQNIQISN